MKSSQVYRLDCMCTGDVIIWAAISAVGWDWSVSPCLEGSWILNRSLLKERRGNPSGSRPVRLKRTFRQQGFWEKRLWNVLDPHCLIPFPLAIASPYRRDPI